jgi:hypothetical protein
MMSPHYSQPLPREQTEIWRKANLLRATNNCPSRTLGAARPRLRASARLPRIGVKIRTLTLELRKQHKLHKAGKVDVSVDVSNGKVVGLTAAHPPKANLQVRKVKSRQKLADTQPAVIRTSMRMAQASD